MLHGDVAAGAPNVLRFDREEDNVGTPVQGRRGGHTDHVRPLETFHEEALRADRIDLSLAADQLDVRAGFLESGAYQTPDCACSVHRNDLRHPQYNLHKGGSELLRIRPRPTGWAV